MTKERISEYDPSADGNTDVNGVNIAEGCAPSGINNAIREVMAALKRFETGSDGDSITVGGNLVVSGATTANTIGATVVNASGNATVGGTLVVTGATTFSGNVVISGSTTATTVATTVVQSDTISEKTSATGVTVDGVLLKDGNVSGTDGAFTGALGVGTAASATAGEIRATNNITAYYSSDRKFKENIRDIDFSLEKVSAIGGKYFDWTDEYISNHGGEDGYFVSKSDFGVIAQDVQGVFPVAVKIREDGSLAVDYEKLCALAFAAIKELEKRVADLESR